MRQLSDDCLIYKSHYSTSVALHFWSIFVLILFMEVFVEFPCPHCIILSLSPKLFILFRNLHIPGTYPHSISSSLSLSLSLSLPNSLHSVLTFLFLTFIPIAPDSHSNSKLLRHDLSFSWHQATLLFQPSFYCHQLFFSYWLSKLLFFFLLAICPSF